MAKIKFTNPEGMTHLKLTGIYITTEPAPDAESQVNIFIRGQVGYMDGSNFIPVYKYETSVTDPQEIASILNTQTQSGQLKNELRRIMMEFLISSGRITGTIE